MAFARSFLTSTEYISQLDPALDREHADHNFAEYRKTGDKAHLRFLEGAQPSVFQLAPLSRIQMTRVLANPSALDQCMDAVAYGLRGVSNFVVDGESVKIEFKTVDGQRRVKGEILDKLFDAQLFGELGSKILELNKLDPTRG